MPTSQKPALDQQVKAFIDKLEAQDSKPLYELSYEEARKVLADTQANPAHKEEVDSEDVTLSVGPTGSVEVRITRPKNSGDRLPVLFYIHGGGWVMGDKETHDRLLREFTVGAGIAVASIIYTPSPEAQYPVPLQQIYSAFEEMVGNAEKYRFDVSKVAVAGDSVGGNMTTALAIMTKQKSGPKIDLQILLYPVTDASLDTQSYQDFADGPWLSKKAMEWFWDAYAPDKNVRNEITASPLKASLEELSGLPEAFIITDQNDVLRDEGEAYAQKLIDAGVKVTSVRYNATIHDFMLLNPISDSSPTRAAIAQTVSVLKTFYQK